MPKGTDKQDSVSKVAQELRAARKAIASANAEFAKFEKRLREIRDRAKAREQ